MKPFRTRDGRVIIDQLCACGHRQSEHSRRRIELSEGELSIEGHGSCAVGDCRCERFNFRDFIFRKESA